MELKLRIIDETKVIFREKGVKFTMDDLASSLGISKRTLYESVKSKEEVLSLVLESVLEQIDKQRNLIIEDSTLDNIEKLKKVLIVLPNSYNTLDYTRLFEVKKFYPEVYKRVNNSLQNGWELVDKLIMDSIQKGIFRRVNLLTIRSILIGSVKEVLENDYLYKEHKDYKEALEEVIDIIFDGLVLKKEDEEK